MQQRPGSAAVIVGVSGSARNLAAVHAAAELAAQLDCPLVAVIAWVSSGGEVVARRTPCPPLERVQRDDALRTLQTSLDDVLPSHPEVRTVKPLAMRGSPGEVLVRVADRCGDRIVIGTGRRGRLARRRSATVRYCVAHADVPILVVPPSRLAEDLENLRRGSRRRMRIPA